MQEKIVPKAPLPWWSAGLMLAMVQILAIGLKKPLGVSTQFVVVEGIALHKAAPNYSQNHAVLKSEKTNRPVNSLTCLKGAGGGYCTVQNADDARVVGW